MFGSLSLHRRWCRCLKWELRFRKCNMSGSINATSRLVKTEIGALRQGIPNENALQRACLEFVGSIRAKPRKAGAPKNPELEIVWRLIEQFGVWRDLLEHRRRLAIDEIYCDSEGICPVLNRHGGLMEQGKTRFYNMPVFAFSYTIVLRGVRWRGEMGDAMGRQELSHHNEFASIVRVEIPDRFCKVFLNYLFEKGKGFQHLRLSFEWV